MNKKKKLASKQKRKKEPITKNDISSDSGSDPEIPLVDEDMDISDIEDLDLKEGKYVIVKYEEEYYPGE